MNNSPSSLYVHIPFCRHICGYCDFPKVFYKDSWAKEYLQALFFELESLHLSPHSMDTIYLGGGTPNCLENEDLAELLCRLRYFLADDGEFSIECNPECVDKEQAKLIIEGGVNRISIGMQSADPGLLKLCERHHGYDDVKRAVETFKEAGIDNISLDLIYALPGESIETALNDLEKAVDLGPDQISIYSLILEGDTKFAFEGLQEASQDEQAAQYEALRARLEEKGYARYEFSSFAKPNKKCRHNLTYWHDEQYYGIGLGAAGYVGDVRYKNTRSIYKYLDKSFRNEEEKISLQDDLEYFFLTNLRLEEGFSLDEFEKRFGFAFLSRYQEAVGELEKEGLVELVDGRFKMKGDKLILLDQALVKLF